MSNRHQERPADGTGKTVSRSFPDSADEVPTPKFLNDDWMKDFGFSAADRGNGRGEDILSGHAQAHRFYQHSPENPWRTSSRCSLRRDFAGAVSLDG